MGSGEIVAGVAPADVPKRARWRWWRVVLAYGVLFGVAVGSIWMIDDHVLKATPAATSRPR
jgi:uncharacterized membrane protein YcjF (UPF0283 family)